MRKAMVVLTCLMAGGCATAYQPVGLTGGYSEVKLNSNTYQITVSGNGYTSADRAQKIALLRAADLTVQNGYSRFVVVGGGVSNQYAGTTPVFVNRIGGTFIASGGDAIVKPGGSMTIRMVNQSDPLFANAIDANLIAAQLRPELQPKS
jgi:hypothetical protein